LLRALPTAVDLPWEVAGAVRVDNQAQFHPYRYCLALAAALERAGGRLFEETRIEDVQVKGDRCAVHGQAEVVTARHVVVATLLPFLDRGGFFVRTHPSRSYALALTLRDEAPRGMYINAEQPTRSIRSLHNGRGLIVVGEQHKVGQEPDTRDRYAVLETWARSSFRVESIDYCWSSQDYYSVDRLPYVGAMPMGSGRVWTATGFNKWGLTTGTAAAMMLVDAIQEKSNPWAAKFSTSRLDLLPAVKDLVVENTNVAERFVGDRLRSFNAPDLEKLTPGEGDLVSHNGERMAAYRDESGEVHACSALCTHMGCVVQWNTAEKSWDCPCHGSRFSHRGEILQGPAVEPLQYKSGTVDRNAAGREEES
jgi:Rieske Fe-S protein